MKPHISNVKQVVDLPVCFSAAVTHVYCCDLLITCIWHAGHQSKTKISQSSAAKITASLEIWPGRRHSTLPEIFNRMLLHGKMLAEQRQIAFLKYLKYKPVPGLKVHYLFQYLEQVDQRALPTFANLTENQSVSDGVWINCVLINQAGVCSRGQFSRHFSLEKGLERKNCPLVNQF